MRLTLLFAMMFSILAGAGEPTPIEIKIQAAIDHDRRTDTDREREKNRQKMEILTFLELQDDMQVLELMPEGGGWYTKILRPLLKEKGKLYLSIDTNSLSTFITDKPSFSTTEVIPLDGIAQSNLENRAQLCSSAASVFASSIWCLSFGMYKTLMLPAGLT